MEPATQSSATSWTSTRRSIQYLYVCYFALNLFLHFRFFIFVHFRWSIAQMVLGQPDSRRMQRTSTCKSNRIVSCSTFDIESWSRKETFRSNAFEQRWTWVLLSPCKATSHTPPRFPTLVWKFERLILAQNSKEASDHRNRSWVLHSRPQWNMRIAWRCYRPSNCTQTNRTTNRTTGRAHHKNEAAKQRLICTSFVTQREQSRIAERCAHCSLLAAQNTSG